MCFVYRWLGGCMGVAVDHASIHITQRGRTSSRRLAHGVRIWLRTCNLGLRGIGLFVGGWVVCHRHGFLIYPQTQPKTTISAHTHYPLPEVEQHGVAPEVGEAPLLHRLPRQGQRRGDEDLRLCLRCCHGLCVLCERREIGRRIMAGPSTPVPSSRPNPAPSTRSTTCVS